MTPQVQPIAKQGLKPKRRFRGRARPDEPLADVCAVRADGCTGRPSERHHVLRRSQGGGDEADNTLDVCHPCHLMIHANPTWAGERGYLRRSS